MNNTIQLVPAFGDGHTSTYDLVIVPPEEGIANVASIFMKVLNPAEDDDAWVDIDPLHGWAYGDFYAGEEGGRTIIIHNERVRFAGMLACSHLNPGMEGPVLDPKILDPTPDDPWDPDPFMQAYPLAVARVVIQGPCIARGFTSSVPYGETHMFNETLELFGDTVLCGEDVVKPRALRIAMGKVGLRAKSRKATPVLIGPGEKLYATHGHPVTGIIGGG